MFEGFDHLRAVINELEAVMKPGPAGDDARQRAMEANERREREAMFDRSMRAVRDHTWKV